MDTIQQAKDLFRLFPALHRICIWENEEDDRKKNCASLALGFLEVNGSSVPEDHKKNSLELQLRNVSDDGLRAKFDRVEGILVTSLLETSGTTGKEELRVEKGNASVSICHILSKKYKC